MSALSIIGFTLCTGANADPDASKTVIFSVYLAPERTSHEATGADVARERIDECATLLASADKPDVKRCQERLTVYTWQRRDRQQTVLTVAPI